MVRRDAGTVDLRRWLLAVTGLALLVRVVVVLATRDTFVLANDGADYHRLAQSILDGHGFGVSHFAPGGGPTALRPPGFPIWLALVEGITGGSVLGARLANAVAGAVVAPLTVLLARRLGLSDRRSLAAGAVAAVLPQLVLTSVAMVSESIFVPLSLASIVAMLYFRRGGSWVPLVTGLGCFGLALVTRPNAALLLLPLALLAAGAPLPRRTVVVRSLVVLAVALAPAVAWEIRSVAAVDRVVPLTTQGGFVLAGTYNATSAGQADQPGVWLPPTLDPHVASLLRSHPDAGEGETERLLSAAAKAYVADHPTYIGTVVAHNTLRMFDLTDPDFVAAVNRGQFGIGGGLARSEQIGTLLLLLLALVGVARGALRSWPVGVWLAPLLLVGTTVFLQSFTRFRAPVDPFLIVLAVSPFFRRRSVPQQREPEVKPDLERGRLPQLDGLRAIAVGMVIVAHLGFLMTMPLSVRRNLSPVLLNDGVELFFILSGFLITSILLRERVGGRGGVLRRFYARRALRIMPAFYVFLAVVGLLALAGRADVTGGQLLVSGLYLKDYSHDVVPWIGHTWSLAVEEQFYLLWPLLLVRVHPRRALTAALVLVAASPFIRMLSYDPADVQHGIAAHVRMDALLVGCALATFPVAFPGAYRRVRDAALRWRVDLAGAVAYLLVLPYVMSPYVSLPVSAEVRFAVGLSLQAVAGCLLLFGLVERPMGGFARVLATRPMRHLGVVSYSLYLWQEPFVIAETDLPMWARVSGLLLAAEVSYWLVERPFLSLKRRYESARARPAAMAASRTSGAVAPDLTG
ncbi:MAG TPA: acyltransferase [Mycobacteriales bacterium]|nr:acyltransferase [Mycobacteriales bacterium]